MPEPTDTTPPKDDAPKPTPPKGGETEGQRDADDGRGGKSAILAELAAERDQRQALQSQVNDLLPLRQQMEALKGVFGAEKVDSSDDIVTTLQQEVATMRRENLVNRVARVHGIAEDDHIALLSVQPSEEAMTALAKILAERQDGRPGTPRPDGSQGKGSGSNAARPTSVTQVMEERRAQREGK